MLQVGFRTQMLLDDKLEQFRSIDSLAKYYAS